MGRFFTPEFFADPYPTYDQLRDEPVRWEEELEGWVLTGYGEVAAALADPRVSRGGGPREGDLLTRLLTRMMLFTDPPRPCAPTRARQPGIHSEACRGVAATDCGDRR